MTKVAMSVSGDVQKLGNKAKAFDRMAYHKWRRQAKYLQVASRLELRKEFRQLRSETFVKEKSTK